MTVQTATDSSSATEALAAKLGARLKGGELIELISDLGGGKTTFVRGLAKGMGSDDHVASPTFMLSRVYKSVDKELHHFDFYRLPEAGVLEHDLKDLLADPKVVVVIEWGGIIEHMLPEKRLTITLVQTGDESRAICFDYPTELEYLVEGLC